MPLLRSGVPSVVIGPKLTFGERVVAEYPSSSFMPGFPDADRISFEYLVGNVHCVKPPPLRSVLGCFLRTSPSF
ncbi:hypothetical protein RJT34_29709 [Clitoria ternatea]|uniref:Uncharacterized protein n=1 Tax=Clitoria ternatea TaxID=43366 RepID=A0AAN9HZR4_CLITE